MKRLLLLLALVVPGQATAAVTVAHQVSAPVRGSHVFRLARPATDVAVHWRGAAQARVRVAFGHGQAQRVRLDETGAARRNGETYGAVMAARGARTVRVWSDRPLRRLTVLALTDFGPSARLLAASTVSQPSVIPRAGWGADESLRFDSTGKEIWPPAFYPVQKLIVHHTATSNNDPDPAATVRSIYYYHAVTQGWGDIGYNFLIDESGRVYEGRYSRVYPAGVSPSGDDANGNGVTAAHAQGYNSGTVGIALLGTLTSQDATAAARSSLEQLLAWEADRHGIDPEGSALYTNPVSGTQATFPNIAGHRDVAATECPGGTFYATLPAIRQDVSAMLGAGTVAPDFSLTVSPASQTVKRGKSTSFTVSVGSTGGFSGSVGLSASGLPAGAAASFSPASVVAPGSSTLKVRVGSSTARGSWTVTVTGASGSSTHAASVTLTVT